MSHSKEKMERMLRDLIKEASRWDLVPKPASLWWTSTYDAEEKVDMILGTTAGCHKFPLRRKFKILGCAVNWQGKSQEAIEERMQSANKAFWKDILIFKSKDVSWKVKCRRLDDHVYPVFAFGSENWSKTKLTLERIKTMLRLFRFKRHEETWLNYHTRTCNMARKIWIKMGLPFLFEKIAESMWRAIRWACDEKSNAVINPLKKIYRWRSTRW